jgi:hypothetical protein
MRVRDALDAYLAENGFTRDAYAAAKTKGSLFGVEISLPNPPSHRRAIMLHDLQHVATGYGTDHAGEAEISAWQLRRGLGGVGLYVSAIVAFNTALGFASAPRRTIAALLGAGAGPSLFGATIPYDELLDRTVGELRAILNVPQEGMARRPRSLHAKAPKTCE